MMRSTPVAQQQLVAASAAASAQQQSSCTFFHNPLSVLLHYVQLHDGFSANEF
jgi:hypothetical protein